MNSISADRFTDWAVRLREDDEEAFADLFRQTYNPMLHYAYSILRNREFARDVLQDMYARIWDIRHRIDHQKSLKALMFQITRNLSFNWLRDHPGQGLSDAEREAAERMAHDYAAELANPAMSGGTVGGLAETDTDTDDERLMLMANLTRWISELPGRQQEAFELSRVDGLVHDEIAQVMECSPATVNNLIVEALKNLRNKYKEFQSENRV